MNCNQDIRGISVSGMFKFYILYNIQSNNFCRCFLRDHTFKEPFAHVLQNRCSYKFHKFHRKTPVLESLFNKVAAPQACNFIKKRLLHRCFPVKFVKFLGTPCFTEHLRWLLLHLWRPRWEGVLKFAAYIQTPLILNDRYIVHFCRRGALNWSFMTLKISNYTVKHSFRKAIALIFYGNNLHHRYLLWIF